MTFHFINSTFPYRRYYEFYNIKFFGVLKKFKNIQGHLPSLKHETMKKSLIIEIIISMNMAAYFHAHSMFLLFFTDKYTCWHCSKQMKCTFLNL